MYKIGTLLKMKYVKFKTQVLIVDATSEYYAVKVIKNNVMSVETISMYHSYLDIYYEVETDSFCQE